MTLKENRKLELPEGWTEADEMEAAKEMGMTLEEWRRKALQWQAQAKWRRMVEQKKSDSSSTK